MLCGRVKPLGFVAMVGGNVEKGADTKAEERLKRRLMKRWKRRLIRRWV